METMLSTAARHRSATAALWRTSRSTAPPCVCPHARVLPRINYVHRSRNIVSARVSLKCNAASSASSVPEFANTEAKPVKGADGSLTSFPDAPGVYAIFNPAGELQYIGLSRKVTCFLHKQSMAKYWENTTVSARYRTRVTAGICDVGRLLKGPARLDTHRKGCLLSSSEP